jgi:SecDF, P1 head subdomain
VHAGSRLIVLGACLCALIGSLQAEAAALGHPARSLSTVYFRPVLCLVPAYDAAARTSVILTPSSCSTASRLDVPALRVAPRESENGSSSHSVPPDVALAGVPSTTPSGETRSATVLLPGLSMPPGSSTERYLLGPAEMTSAAVARASAAKNQTGAWVVDYTTTKRGAALLDKVAHANFHELLGIDLDGVVVSVAIMEPAQSSFTSLDGRGEISGNLDRSEAIELARALQSGQG